jgi:diguanylate cyclase (GGDEF)-like protein
LIERDGLTGLIDHQRLIERIGQELSRSRRTGAECTLAMLDLDHFKQVNDTWGHQAGDLVLRRLANALTGWLRQSDVVGRYGGEEFAVLLLDTTPEQAAPVIDAFRRNFAALDIVVPGGTLSATFSAGLAGSRLATDTSALVSAADAALYRAKSEGRDRVVIAEAPSPATLTRPLSARPDRLRRVNRLIRAAARRTDGAEDAPTSP